MAAHGFMGRRLVGEPSAALGVRHGHRGWARGFAASRLGGVAAHAAQHRFTLKPLLRCQGLGRGASGTRAASASAPRKPAGLVVCPFLLKTIFG